MLRPIKLKISIHIPLQIYVYLYIQIFILSTLSLKECHQVFHPRKTLHTIAIFLMLGMLEVTDDTPFAAAL